MNIKKIMIVGIIIIMLTTVITPVALGSDIDYVKGCDKGPSYKSVVPLKKVTLVDFDKESLLDDYAYLASIPTSIFNYNNRLYSHPLLYFEDKYPVKEDKERSLNTRQGIDYFMEDWMKISDGRLDQMTLVNVPKSKIDSSWNADEYVMIDGDDPFSIANQIALQEWSYSDEAVVAVIDEKYVKPDEVTNDEVTGTLTKNKVKNLPLKVEKPVIGIGATFESFDIDNDLYKYIVARLAWNSKVDYDLQLYDDQLGMVQAAAGAYSDDFPYEEITASYIHNYGKWEAGVSAVPKKGVSDDPGRMESLLYDDASEESTGILSLFDKNTLDVDIHLYPGTEIDLAPTPFGCRDVELTLTWNNPEVNLGLTVLDPVGTEIASSISTDQLKHEEVNEEKTEATVHINKLGECSEGQNYKVCVFSLDDITHSVDFTVDYSWQQNFSKKEGECLESASNGAVLASSLNAPLIFVSPSEITDDTKDVFYKLGVNNVHLVNIGGYLSDGVKKEIKKISNIKNNCKTSRDIYDLIEKKSGNKDIIFSTIDPWDYWYVKELKSAGSYPGALHVGPAAYIAAHHGSPVVIVDNHPRLSQAISYHTDFWHKCACNRLIEPSSGSMVLSSGLVYDFIEDYGFGKLERDDQGMVKKSSGQDHETIITVAGQFDIGTPWDRSFTGAAFPGRFWGSPVDSAYAICRNVFYPSLIFANPGMEEVKIQQGSKSKTQAIGGRLKNPLGVNLNIYQPITEETVKYPVLQTYQSYQYRFNKEGYKHWDFKYTRADDITPYETPSNHPIDDGAAITKTGSYYPDQSETEVIPFYCDKAGYDSVFSTNFDYITENLNQGMLIWVVNAHGYYTNGGMLSMWNPESPYVYEENPWRAYEPVLFKPGHLRTYLHFLPYYYYMLFRIAGQDMSILKTISSIRPLKLQLFPEVGSTDNPDVACINPQLIYLNKLIKPIKSLTFYHDLWGASGVMLYRDRLKQPLKTIDKGLPFINYYDGDGKVTISPGSGHEPTMKWRFGYEFDDAIGNLHSCGINTISCLPANTYLHLTWMRHGATYQIIDPWTTTDWAGTWQQMLIKSFAIGDTIGEAYEKGMRACGPEYPVNQWWWDVWENVELFGDPDLRVYVPNTEFSNENHWGREETQPNHYDNDLSLMGHMPFGADSYPNEKQPQADIPLTMIIGVMVIIIIILIAAFMYRKKK